MYVRFGRYLLDVDAERTRSFYRTLLPVSARCSCQGCRNYARAAETLPREVLQCFDTLGIDVRKATEVYVNETTPDGGLLYAGWYHLCGALLEGEPPYAEAPTGGAVVWDADRTCTVTPDFRLWFEQKKDLLPDGFPEPAVQMEIDAYIPWALDELNELNEYLP